MSSMSKETKERLKKETEELAGKFERLEKFIGSEKFDSLREVSQHLLLEQHDAMGKYLNILRCRLDLDDLEKLSETTNGN